MRRYHGEAAGREARRRFDERFSRRELPADAIPEEKRTGVMPQEIALPAFLTEAGLTKSNTDARRLIGQGAVRINGRVVVSDRFQRENVEASGDPCLLVVEVGKRRARRFRFDA